MRLGEPEGIDRGHQSRPVANPSRKCISGNGPHLTKLRLEHSKGIGAYHEDDDNKLETIGGCEGKSFIADHRETSGEAPGIAKG